MGNQQYNPTNHNQSFSCSKLLSQIFNSEQQEIEKFINNRRKKSRKRMFTLTPDVKNTQQDNQYTATTNLGYSHQGNRNYLNVAQQQYYGLNNSQSSIYISQNDQQSQNYGQKYSKYHNDKVSNCENPQYLTDHKRPNQLSNKQVMKQNQEKKRNKQRKTQLLKTYLRIKYKNKNKQHIIQQSNPQQSFISQFSQMKLIQQQSQIQKLLQNQIQRLIEQQKLQQFKTKKQQQQQLMKKSKYQFLPIRQKQLKQSQSKYISSKFLNFTDIDVLKSKMQ